MEEYFAVGSSTGAVLRSTQFNWTSTFVKGSSTGRTNTW